MKTKQYALMYLLGAPLTAMFYCVIIFATFYMHVVIQSASPPAGLMLEFAGIFLLGAITAALLSCLLGLPSGAAAYTTIRYLQRDGGEPTRLALIAAGIAAGIVAVLIFPFVADYFEQQGRSRPPLYRELFFPYAWKSETGFIVLAAINTAALLVSTTIATFVAWWLTKKLSHRLEVN